MAKPTTQTTQSEQATELYAQLKPEAQVVYLDHIMSRTPAELQDEMKTIVADDLAAAPEDPLVASVSDGQNVIVQDALGVAAPGSPGVASVAASALVNVKLGAAVLTTGQRQGSQSQGDVHRGTIPPRR